MADALLAAIRHRTFTSKSGTVVLPVGVVDIAEARAVVAAIDKARSPINSEFTRSDRAARKKPDAPDQRHAGHFGRSLRSNDNAYED